MLKKSFTKSFEEKIIECCWVHKDSSNEEEKSSNKLSDKIWEIEPSGKFLNLMIESIEKAKNRICISSFLIAEEKLIEALMNASDRGVNVYLLTSEVRLEDEIDEDDTFNRNVTEQHHKLLDELAGHVLVRTAPHFHSKFILVDPHNSQNFKGFLLTANLTKEALTRNKEIGVILSVETAQELYEQFCHGFWGESEHELLEIGQFGAVTKKSDLILPYFGKIYCTTGKNLSLKSEIKALISNSDGELIISSYGFDIDHEITDLIIREIQKGRKVSILTRNRPKKMDVLKKFKEAGAEVYAHKWHHAKAVLAMNGIELEGMIFTANLEKRGLDQGFESGIRLSNDDALELRRILNNWLDEFPLVLQTNIPVKNIVGKVKVVENNSFKDIEVKPFQEVDLGEIEAESIDDLEATVPKKLPEPENEISHKIHYNYKVIPPQLPKNAKKTEIKSPLPMYEKNNKRFVLISDEMELQSARVLAEKYKAKIVVRTQ